MNLHRRQSLRLGAGLLSLPLWSGSAWAGSATATPSMAPADAAPALATDAALAALPFEAFSEQLAADWIRLSPEWATVTQYFGGEEQAALDRQLTPLTEAHRARYTALAKAGLAQLARWPAERLPQTLRSSAATLSWSLQRQVDSAPFEDHNFLFNQLRGPQVRYAGFLAETQPLARVEQVAAYLERLAGVPQRFDEALARADAAAAKGLLPPRFILERARGQVQAALKMAPEQSDFVSGLARRGQRTQGLDEAARLQAVDAATRLVKEQVYPAHERVLAWMDRLHPRTRSDAGLWRLPDGSAAYAQALAANTTTAMSAEEIHALGLQEVARIEAEMDRLLKSLGRSQGTVEQRMDALRKELQPPAEPDPRPALLERYREAVADAQRRAQPLFDLQPRSPVEVRRVPAATERTSSAYYTTPAPDGSRPGVFWAPLPGPQFNLLGMRTLAIHEAVPGHHFQLALQQESTNLPRWRQRRIFGGGSAHSEGWALYAERLAIEHGWYEGDVHGLLGAWDAQLFRARRLVVDTGLHAKRWTRQQGIDYGISPREVERYVANPGQACAYMVGMLHILALREEAKLAQGAKFSLPAFHNLVLRTGSVPLAVLSDEVRAWGLQTR